MRTGDGLPAGSRIVLGNYGLFKGIAVATGLWLAAATVVYTIGLLQPGAGETSPFRMWLFMMVAFGGLSLLVGIPLGLVLGLLLRPVRRQGIHVAVFFAVPAALFWAALGFGSAAAVIGLSVGAAAAAGRLSVCRDIEIVPSPAGR